MAFLGRRIYVKYRYRTLCRAGKKSTRRAAHELEKSLKVGNKQRW